MYKLKATFQGFTFGARCADSFACEVVPRMDPDVARSGLHAIKGTAHIQGMVRDIKAFSVNGVLYSAV